MWRYQKRGVAEKAYPVKTSRLFPMLEGVKRIDAVFENVDGTAVFFSGSCKNCNKDLSYCVGK